MSKKYIIEIEDEPVSKDGVELWKVCGFNSLVFDQNGLDKLKSYDPFIDRKTEIEYERNEAYNRGLADAWEAAKKICTNWTISDEALIEIFGGNYTIDYIMQNHTASEAIAKLKAYEEQQKNKIEVGDEVKLLYKNQYTAEPMIVTLVDEGAYADLLCLTMSGKYIPTQAKRVYKTGRHFPEIAQVLERLKEEQK